MICFTFLLQYTLGTVLLYFFFFYLSNKQLEHEETREITLKKKKSFNFNKGFCYTQFHDGEIVVLVSYDALLCCFKMEM